MQEEKYEKCIFILHGKLMMIMAAAYIVWLSVVICLKIFRLFQLTIRGHENLQVEQLVVGYREVINFLIH